jgi:hypothetical protein
MPKPKWWKKLTQNFTRATQCGFNFNSISFYSFTSIDSCRQGKRCCCVTSETLQCRSSDRPLENLKYHKVMKRIRKKTKFYDACTVYWDGGHNDTGGELRCLCVREL